MRRKHAYLTGRSISEDRCAIQVSYTDTLVRPDSRMAALFDPLVDEPLRRHRIPERRVSVCTREGRLTQNLVLNEKGRNLEDSGPEKRGRSGPRSLGRSRREDVLIDTEQVRRVVLALD